MKKQPTNVSAPSDLIREVKAMARKEGTTLSIMVNDILKDYIKQERRRRARLAKKQAAAAA